MSDCAADGNATSDELARRTTVKRATRFRIVDDVIARNSWFQVVTGRESKSGLNGSYNAVDASNEGIVAEGSSEVKECFRAVIRYFYGGTAWTPQKRVPTGDHRASRLQMRP